MNDASFLDAVKFDSDGLVPAIAQDYKTGAVLMMAWMNRQSLGLSIAEGRAVYWSRSRNKIWRKGEESGNTQRLMELRLDCDGDTVLLMVDPLGGIACHTGREHCFYRKLEGNQWQITDDVKREPSDMYGNGDE